MIETINEGGNMAEDTTSPKEEQPAAVPTPTPEATPVSVETPVQAPVQAAPVAAQAPIAPANGLAIAAMVVGIVAVLSGWIPLWGLLVSAAAIVLGVLGVKKANGKGMAITGIVTGAVGALWALIVTAFFVIAIVASATAAERSREASLEKEKQTQSIIDSKKDFAKGETAQFGDELKVKINSVERNYAPGASYVPAAGKEYIVVKLTIENISDKSKYIMTYDFGVLDNGFAEKSSFAPVSKELEGGSLADGESTTGNLVYEVTKDATDLKLQYTVTVFDSAYKAKKLTYTLAF